MISRQLNGPSIRIQVLILDRLVVGIMIAFAKGFEFVSPSHIRMPTVHTRLNPEGIGKGGCVAAAEAQIVTLERIAIEIRTVIFFMSARESVVPAVQLVGMAKLQVAGVHAATGGADVTTAEQGR